MASRNRSIYSPISLPVSLSCEQEDTRMATNPKGIASCSDPSKILGQYPHFFKVVIFPSDQGLKIPDAFMKKYGGDLQELILLKVPNGPSWPVEIIHFGNGTLIRKGWQEFAEFYSIKMFYFLVFGYEGNSQFHVLIFDPTASEIEYPSKIKGERSGRLNQTLEPRDSPCVGTKLNTDDDIEEECLNSYETTPNSKAKRAREEDIQDDVSVEIIGHISECKPGMSARTRSSRRLKTETVHSKKKRFLETRRTKEIDKEKFKSYQEAKAFRSSRPFFISFMLPSNVSYNFHLNVPRKFVENHLSTDNKGCNFMLHVSGNNKKWPVILNVYHERSIRLKITRGFRTFVQDNNLKMGDVCVFELGQGSREFKITVYRSAESERTA